MGFVPSQRRCRECKIKFADPESFRRHKRIDMNCRTVEALKAVGYTLTDKGWKATRVPPNSNR